MRGVLARQLLAEFLGTALLLAAIVGSGITAAVDGAASAQLFHHAVAVGVALVALVLAFGPVSGAHLNPAVTAADWWLGGISGRRAIGYVAAQLAGAIAGTAATHLMFGLPAVTWASMPRDGVGLAAAEAVATGGLIVVIFGLIRSGATGQVPGAVGAWIGAAIYFTASASFANPAVTLARVLTDTFTGIAAGSVPGFLAGQVVGVVVAVGLVRLLYDPSAAQAGDVLVPHEQPAGPAAGGGDPPAGDGSHGSDEGRTVEVVGE